MSHEIESVSGVLTVNLAVPSQDATANVDAVDVIGNKSDTVAGTSIVGMIKAIQAALSIISGQTSSGEAKGTFSYLDAGGEQTVFEMIFTARKIIHGIWLDFTTITQNGTIKIYYKIDGTNYREVESYAFTVATDSDGFYIDLNMGITDHFKVTYTEGGDEGADRAIPYSVIYQAVE